MTKSRARFIVYRTLNLVNGKIYIGVHKTYNIEDDPYLGSGKVIQAAIKKYGRKNFNRKTLYIFDTAKEAYQKEREIVNKEFIKNKDHYNVRVGGRGGFSYSHEEAIYYGKMSSETNKKIGKERKEKNKQNYYNNPNFCKFCKKTIPYERKQYSFCNHSCAAKYNNMHREYVVTEDIKNKIRKSKKISDIKKGLRLHKGIYFCQKCGKELRTQRKNNMCGNCYKVYRKKEFNLKEAISLRKQGWTMAKIAKKYNVSVTSISSWLRSEI